MKDYVGVKNVQGEPMTRGEYLKLRGWKSVGNDKAEEKGYLVKYIPTENDNMPGLFKEFLSWSPKEVFEDMYEEVNIEI